MATLPDTLSFNAMQARVSRILEIGDGDYGYGQIALSQQLDGVTPANLLDFQNLRTDILAAKQHQVGVLTTLPITLITNSITATQWAAFETVLKQVEANRTVTPPVAQAARDILVSDTITTDWNGTTTQIVTAEFVDEDAIRNYFNTGSSIEFSASRSAGASTTKNSSWTSLLANIGVISFKRSATSSTKSVGTSIGYSRLTDSYQVIFQKLTTDTLKPNTYKLSARLVDSRTIEFTVEFTDGSTSLSDPNVNGTLTSNVNAYHASGVFVAVPAPSAVGEMSAGQANPSFIITRDSTSIGEGQTGVTFTITTVNFDDAPLYWNVKGYGITAADFVEATLQDSFAITSGVGSFSLTASDDKFTEGTEKFVVEIRVAPELTSPVVATIASAPEIINDLSLTVPVTRTTPSYNFVSQSVSATAEGNTITYTVVTTGVADNTQLYWATKGLTAGITAADFEDNTLTGTITIWNNTADIVRTLVDDKAVEQIESFQIVLSTIDATTGVKRQVQISYLMQIVDTAVVVTDVPYLVSTSLTTVPEGSVLAVNYKITTPKLPINTRLYWQTFSDIGKINGSDFNDGLLSGSVLISNQIGVVPRYLKADGVTEGLESFHLTFYSDAAMTNELQEGPTVSITESVSYLITKDYSAMAEGGLGINFTVNTPALENGKNLYYRVVSESGTVDADDLVDGVSGIFAVNNNVGKFLIRAKDDTLTEGVEQFRVEIRETDGVSGAILVSSQSSTITEPNVYDILSQRSAITEGQIGVEFTIKTPKVANGTVLYWSTVTDTGTITASDFTDNTLTGTVTITNNIGSITRTAVVDALTEGDESFHLVLKTGSASGTTVKIGDPVTLSEDVKYSITPSTQSIAETGAGVTFNVTTPKSSNGSLVFWSILPGSGNITADDFIVSDAQGGSAQRLTGRVSIQNNRGSFIIAARPDSLTEGSETFQVELRTDDIDGPVEKTTREITISETVSYQVIAGTSTVTEGPGSVTFTVKTPKVADNTELYWTTRSASGTVSEADFKDSTLQGKVTIVGNEGTIIRTAKDDVLTEGVDAFIIELRLTSYGSPVVVSSVPVTIQDTSITIEVPEPEAPVYSVTTSATSIIKGGAVVFTVHTENVTNTTNLYWTLFRSPGLEITDFVTAVSPTAVNVTYDDGSTPANGTKEITVTTQALSPGTGVRSFIFELRTGSVYGKVVATSTTAVTISDEIKYAISPSTRSIAEGAGLVTFTVTTPALAIGNTLGWTVVGNTGTLEAIDFNDGQTPTPGPGSLTGNFSITGVGTGAGRYGTGTITLYASADETTEGNETFHIELANGLTPIVLGSPSPIIAISEVVEYVLSANTASISEGGDGVTFTLNTPKLKANSIFNYTIVGKTGSIAAQDFVTTAGGSTTLSSLTGTFTVNSTTNSGTFTLYAASDAGTEGDESFTISLTSATGQSIAIGGTGSPTVTITETVAYTITPTASQISTVQVTSFAEGIPAYFKVTTPKMDDGDLFWVITPTPSTSGINENDFADKQMTGTVSIVKNKGTIIIPHATDSNTEGNETYSLVLKRDSVEGTTVTTSPTVLITESISYKIISDTTVIAEGGSVTFTVTTPFADNGETLNWTVVQVTGTMISADFVAFSGTTLPVANSTAIITVTAAPDAQIEPTDTFTIAVTKSGLPLSPLTGVIPTITVSDGTNYTLTSDVTTIAESGSAVTFTVRTPGISKETALYWSIQGVAGAIDPTDFVKATGTVTITGHVGTFGVTAAPDKLPAENDSFSVVLRSGSQTGPIINIDNTPIITITDIEFYTIKADKTKIAEDGVPVTYTITTPTAANGSRLYWTVIGPKGLTPATKNLTPADFTIATLPNGTLIANATSAVVTNKTVTIQLAAAIDQATDGDKEFYIQVMNTATGIPIAFAEPCPKVVITDTSGKPAVVTKTIEITVQSAPARIIESGAGEIIIAITPFNTNVLKPLDVKWKISTSTPQGISTALSTSASTPFKLVNSGTFTTVIDPTSPLVSTAKLKLFADKLAVNASGSFQVEFTVTDPVTNTPFIITTKPIEVMKGDAFIEIQYGKGPQWWPKTAGVNFYQIELIGGGGQGGGAGAAIGGSAGGNAAAVKGIVNLTDLQGIGFSFIDGGVSAYATGYSGKGDNDKDGDDNYDWGGIGGAGGAGIAMYLGGTNAKPVNGTPWVTVGGAGGGGAGRLNGTGPGIPGSTGVKGTSAYAATYIAPGVSATSAKSPGNGGGGGGGGMVDTQAYLEYPSAVSRNGGVGGNSYVPVDSRFVYIPDGGGLGGAGVQLIAATPQEGLGTSMTINKKFYPIPTFFTNHAIAPPYNTRFTDTLFVSWPNVVSSKTKPQNENSPAVTAGQPIPQGDYILEIWTDGYGSVAVGDKKPYDGTLPVTTYNISLAADWNNRITLSYKWFKNPKNYCSTEGIAATLRRNCSSDIISNDNNYIWTTRSPGSYIRPQIGSGTSGTPAKVRISWGPSVPTTKAAKPVVTTKAVTYPVSTPAAPAVPSIPARNFSIVSYYTWDGLSGWPYYSYIANSWSDTMYWEDLFIPVTPGMTFEVKLDDSGTAKLTDTVGNTQIITQPDLNGNPANTLPVQAVNQTLGAIVRIDLSYVDSHGVAAGAHGVIKDSNGVVLWTSRDQAIHYK